MKLFIFLFLSLVSGVLMGQINGATSVCPNATQTYTSAAFAPSYSWSVLGGTIQGSSTSLSVSILWGAGAATQRVTLIANSTTHTKNVSIYKGTATVSPAGNLCIGSSKTLSVTFFGTFSQWQKSTNGTSWSTEGTTATLAVSPTVTTQYRAVITGMTGCTTVYSNVVTVTAYAPLDPGSISSDATICYGATSPTINQATAPSGDASPYSFQWEQRPPGGSWAIIGGVTTSSYSPGSLMSTTEFRRKASGSACSTSSYTVPVTITVRGQLSGGTIGNAQSICYNNAPAALASLTPAAGSTGSFFYQWEQQIGGGSWTEISGQISAGYTPPTLTTTTSFRRKVTSGCSDIAYSNTITITVDPLSVGGTLGANREDYGISSGILTLSGQVGTVQKWQTRPPAGSWTDISNTAPSLSYSNITQTAEYRAVVKSGNCAEATSSVVTIYIYNVPTVQIVGETAIAPGGSAVISTGSYYTYQWWKNGQSLSGQTGQSLTVTSPGAYKVSVKASVTAPTYTTGEAQITESMSTQLTALNYIYETNFLVAGVTTSTDLYSLNPASLGQTVQYFDGLGRPIQTVSIGSSPEKKDVVSAMEYDPFNRISKQYLPYTSTAGNGQFKQTAIKSEGGTFNGSKQQLFYQNAVAVAHDAKPFSETTFESSPVGRPLKTYGAGEEWGISESNKFMESKYSFNIHGTESSGTSEKIIAWKVNSSGVPVRSAAVTNFVENGGYYSSNQIHVTTITDENGNPIREYKNKLGQTILKKVLADQAAAGNLNDTTKWALTYYLYDDAGNLRFVFQPVLSKRLHFKADNYTLSSTDLDNGSFQYKYDGRKRMTEKKVPGSGTIYMVYDNRDRLVLTQDANQRSGSTKYWTFTKYDELNRPILTGIKDSSCTLAAMQSAVDGHYAKTWTKFGEKYIGSNTGNVHGYSNYSYPIATNGATVDASRFLTATYYDNYAFGTLVFSPSYTVPTFAYTRIKGQITGQKIKILDGGVAGTTWLKVLNYYDDHYRLIQTIADNFKGGVDTVKNVFDFSGKVLESKRIYSTGGSTYTVKETFVYDHAGRITTTKHSVNGASDVIVVSNQYNELGQLVDKKLHSNDNGATFRQSIDYRYNIRGWLTSVNNSKLDNTTNNDDVDDIFGMELGYESDLGLTGTPQFNGNITAMKWSNNTTESNILQRGYAYSYDGMNRLKTANQKQAIVFENWTSGNYDENITDYDLNGNILGLQRKDGAGSLMDNLSYNYTNASNKLLYVHDIASATQGFVNGNTGTDDYAYDSNGNLNLDKNKGITAITYNHLNLPQQVNKGATDYIVYTYDASGKKLSQRVFGTSAKTTDYLGELIFENNTLRFVNHSEGRVVPDGANWEYQYHLKDHLGNVRSTFTTKQITNANTATLETANLISEQSQFLRFAEAKRIQSHLFDYTNGSSPSTSTGYAQRLNGTANEKFGLGKSLSVMAGDVVSAEVYAKYIDPVSNNWTAALNTLLNQIAGGTAPAGTVLDGVSYNNSTINFPFPSQATSNTLGSTGTGPKAYLNWLVFKRDGTLILSQSGYHRLSSSPKESGLDVGHEKLYSPNITITEPGFVYIYLSNEETTPLEVYFDEFKVTHTVKTPVVQSDDYYPFGLTFNSYSRENSTEQKYKYNGMEEQDELSLNWLDYGARMYDPAIARWMVVDPMSDKARRMSPYSYVYNNPLIFVDPDGMFGEYYTEAGKYLGTDGIDDKKVYTADQATTPTTKAEDGTETTTTTFENTEQIGVESDFVDMNGKTISSDETKKDLVGLAIYLRNEEGVEGAKVTVQGGDRDAAKNKKVGGATGSPHMAGHAADISVSGMTNEALAIAAGNSGLFTGVIYYPAAGDTQGFGTHPEQKEAYVWFDKITYNQTTPNYQNLPAHVHVDNRSGTGVSRRRYAGDTSKDKTKQTGTYVPWVSNSQIK